MKWTYLLLIFSLHFCSISLYSQESCNDQSKLWHDYKQYIPRDGSSVFTIRLNFVILQKSDGTGNFSQDDPDTEWIFRKTIQKANELYAKLEDPKDKTCYTEGDFIPNTYIQFELNEIIYVKDDYYWNADNGSGCPNNKNWYLNDLEKEIRKNPAYDNAINIYQPISKKAHVDLITAKNRDSPKASSPCSELPTRKELDRSSRICIAGHYSKYLWTKEIYTNDPTLNKNNYPWDPVIKNWQWSSPGHTIAHELGHSLGLAHSNQYHRRNECEFSIMNQLHNKPHNYLQPTEIGKIHRNLRVTNIRNFLVEDVYNPYPMMVEEDMFIDIDYKSYEDIIVKSGMTLTVTCNLSFPKGAGIILEKGAKLMVNNGVVSGRDGGTDWKGISYVKERRCFLKKKPKNETLPIEIAENGKLNGPINKRKR